MKQWADGSKYDGEWVYGEAHGKGSKVLPQDKKTRFNGDWEHNELVKGKCTYSEGEYYEGEWKEGKPWGKGRKTWKNERKYSGEFFDGKPVGMGRKIDKDNKSIHGYWVSGKFFEGEPREGLLE